MDNGIVKKDGTYYVEVPAQGSRRCFLSPAGTTLKEARRRLRELTGPPDVRDFALFGHYHLEVDEGALWRAAARFRRADAKTFASRKRIAIQTERPECFHHPASGLGNALRANGFTFDTVSTEELRQGRLAEFDVAVFPGGFGYFPDAELGERIKDFIRGGGGFLGVCAGAFLPLKDSCGVKGACLGILDATYAYFRERGLSLVALNPDDPVARGLESSTRQPVYALYKPPRAMRRYTTYVAIERGNGPLILPGPRAKVVGYYDGSEKYAAIVRGTYGKGRILVFSAHPDAYLDTARMGATADAVECLKLFKNGVLYCGRM